MANRSRGTGTRMGKQWDSLPAISLELTTDATVAGGSLASTTSQTILRMLGEYIIASTGVATALDQATVGIGIGIISTDAFTLGATAMPDPLGEPEFPWLYWASHSIFYPTAVSATAGQGDQSGVGTGRFPFDVKSMRKMKPRESLFFVAQYGDVSGTPPLRVGVANTRVLLGLH